jgi:hypothetical protein
MAALSVAAAAVSAGTLRHSSSSAARRHAALPTRPVHARRHPTQSQHVVARGIGFDLSGETAADKLRPDEECRQLIDDAASLLFLQECMRGGAVQVESS